MIFFTAGRGSVGTVPYYVAFTLFRVANCGTGPVETTRLHLAYCLHLIIVTCVTKTHTTKQECGVLFTTISFSHPKHNQLTLATSGQPKVGHKWPCL